MKNFTKPKLTGLLFLFPFIAALFVSVIGFAQTSTLAGRIIDERTNVPLAGATIQIKGSTHKVVTNDKGEFTFITAQHLPLTYIVSYVGYQTIEAIQDGPGLFTITLVQANNKLKDIVVVGYGTQSRKNLASAVSSVNTSQIEDVPAASIDQLLQGKAAGVLASANSPVPGTGIFLRVRGSTSINATNDPLYVVDGVFINNRSLQSVSTGGQVTNPLADLNPADIESIEILKDANATAIYGSRGANGVVVITTKHGKLNNKAKVNIGYYYGSSSARKFWKTLAGPEEGILQNETWLNDGKPYATRPFRPVAEGGLGLPEEQPTNDRIGIIFQDAPTHNIDISTTGGDTKTSFYIGGNYYDQEAIVKPDAFKRYSVRVNLDHQLRESAKIGFSIDGVKTDRIKSPNNNVPYGAVNGALYTPAYLPLFNPDGSYARPSLFENPYAAIREVNFTDIGARFTGNGFGEFTIVKGLKFRTSWSIDFNESKEDNFYSSKTYVGQAPTNGSATSAITRNLTLINEQLLTYNKTFNGVHLLSLTAGNTIQKERFEITSVTGIGFPTDEFSKIASAAIQTGTSSSSDAGLVSYFSRVNYILNNKYSIDINFRADASSRFGKDHRWGYFPAAGVSWRAGQEDFVRALGIFTDLKFRASYGSTGNQNGIPDFAAKGLWSGGNNYQDVSGTAPNQLANPDLRWETTKQADIGIDAGFLANRITVGFDFYRKYTTNLLLQLPIASQTGYNNIFANAGEMSNEGYELNINADLCQYKNFTWSFNLNVATNKNKIQKLPAPIIKTGVIILQEGSPLYSFYLHKQFGVDPQTGNVLFDDLNKDGNVTDADLQILGNAWPKYFGGLTNEFTVFKNFDVQASLYYSLGNDVWNNTRYRMGHGGSRNGVFAMLKEELGRWQKTGDITDVPRLTVAGNNAAIIPSRFLEDGSFVRLRNLSVGYSIPKSLLNRWSITTLRLYFSATNLFTLTKYKGVDPEVNVSNGDQNILGYDQAIAPQPRTLQVGFNIAF
ncbi:MULTISPECIES: SusC/RagA family TonB-linked outer membrane protein [Niastella]|uniref:TonB-dependent receptor n=1 Tax=Niastella soli TaxID=2821487 RepID=A0ABS3Z2B0_9BACT|nr:TonB-dependent receptor [Niastella soli]MBO9204264.1 TonB-dependent receptor [Niastella soli]